MDFITKAPNPILHVEWDTWYIMSKTWTEKHGAALPQAATKEKENYATRHANGTGPFMLVSHEAGVKTVFTGNPNWWDNKNKVSNVTEVIFTPSGNDATRVAALLSGQVDMAYPVPVQDMKRVDGNAATRMLVGPELRTIFLGMDQERDELLYSNIKRIEGLPAQNQPASPAMRHDDDLAALMPTSGSTGTPRLVAVTHGNLRHNTEAIIHSQNLTRDDRAMLILPPVLGGQGLGTGVLRGAGPLAAERSNLRFHEGDIERLIASQ